MISVYRADQLKSFAPFSYLNHSFIFSLNVKVCIRLVQFFRFHSFFICQELCWMRGLWISFTSSCFLFPVRGEGVRSCPFLPFYLHKTQKNWNFEKMLKIARDITILHMCTKNHNHMRYGSSDTEWDRIFYHFGPVFALLPRHNPENRNFEKMKKSIWRCHHFTQVYQKSLSYDVCFQKYGVRQI